MAPRSRGLGGVELPGGSRASHLLCSGTLSQTTASPALASLGPAPGGLGVFSPIWDLVAWSLQGADPGVCH